VLLNLLSHSFFQDIATDNLSICLSFLDNVVY
jgi:hypothetical protein